MLAQTFSCIAALLAALLAIVLASPLVLPAVLLVGLAFGRIVCDYQPSAAEAKRLVSVLHGPVMTHMLEAHAGREYARSFGQAPRVVAHALDLLEVSSRAQSFNIGLQRWLALRLELLGALTLFAVAATCVAARRDGNAQQLGLPGLSLTYALTLTALAKYLVNTGTHADLTLTLTLTPNPNP